METKNERYVFGEKLAIDVVATRRDDLMMKGIGLIIMSGEKKTSGEREPEYAHDVKEILIFKDSYNLKLAQIGLELLQRAIFDEEELTD